MKQIITNEEVSKAMADLATQGKKPTLSALHAALNNRGSMSTLVRLKAEIEAAAQPMCARRNRRQTKHRPLEVGGHHCENQRRQKNQERL
jgi:hypothetical protein